MGIFDKAKEMGNIAIAKGKDLAQITKLNIDISANEGKISEHKKIIGEIIVSNNIDIDNVDIKKQIDIIRDLIKDIDNKKKEILNIENKIEK